MNMARALLQAAGWMSMAASLLHLAVIVGGPDWYRFFGAGEPMAQAAARGSITPALITCAIAAILAVWAAYAFSAAGMIQRLPLTRTALVAISFVLLARAAMVAVPGLWAPEQTLTFKLWSSGIVLVMGLCFALGTWGRWATMSGPTQP